MMDSLNQYEAELSQCVSQYEGLLRSYNDKVCKVKAEILKSFAEKSKNSRVLFKNLIESLDGSFAQEAEGVEKESGPPDETPYESASLDGLNTIPEE